MSLADCLDYSNCHGKTRPTVVALFPPWLWVLDCECRKWAEQWACSHSPSLVLAVNVMWLAIWSSSTLTPQFGWAVTGTGSKANPFSPRWVFVRVFYTAAAATDGIDFSEWEEEHPMGWGPRMNKKQKASPAPASTRDRLDHQTVARISPSSFKFPLSGSLSQQQKSSRYTIYDRSETSCFALEYSIKKEEHWLCTSGLLIS